MTPNRTACAIDLGIAALLIAGTIAVYWQVRNFDYLRFDDPYVFQNQFVQSGVNSASIRYAITASESGNWNPLTLLTEMLVVQFFGHSSGAMHLACVLIHAANTALLFLFLRWTTGLRWPAMVVAMLWAWHPLRVESVAWLGELRDSLCGFFWLLAMLAFAHYRSRPGAARYLGVCFCLVLALLSKSMAMTLPAALFLLNFWPLRQANEIINRSWWLTRVIEQLPLLLICVFVSFVALHAQVQSGFTGSLEQFPVSLRLTNGAWSYLRYMGKELFPVNMGLIYPHPGMLGRTVPVVEWVSALTILTAVTAAAWRFRRNAPFLLIGWLWFLGTLVPVIGLIQLGEASMADRYTYIPSMGLTTAAVWLFYPWLSTHRRWQMTAGLCASVLVLAAAMTTRNQIGYWQNNYTLMSHSNAVIEDNFLAMSSLAMDEAAMGHSDQAIRLGRSAVKLVPENQEAHHALALAYRSGGDLGNAFAEMKRSVKLDPNRAILRLELGKLLVQMQRISDAQGQFKRAVELEPDLAEAHDYLAATLASSGDYDGAIAEWKIAVGLDPHQPLAQGLLADALRLRGDRAGAIEHYRAALNDGATDPGIKANLAWELAIDPATSPGDLQAMLPIARQACEQTHSQLPFPLYAYSLALARVNRFDDAIQAAGTALQLAENNHQTAMAAEIRNRLAAYRRGRIAERVLSGDHPTTACLATARREVICVHFCRWKI